MVRRPYKRCWVRAKVFDLGSFRGNDAIGQGENRHAHWSECCDRDSCNTVTYNIYATLASYCANIILEADSNHIGILVFIDFHNSTFSVHLWSFEPEAVWDFYVVYVVTTSPHTDRDRLTSLYHVCFAMHTSDVLIQA